MEAERDMYASQLERANKENASLSRRLQVALVSIQSPPYQSFQLNLPVIKANIVLLQEMDPQHVYIQ